MWSWSLYSGYSLYGDVVFILPIFPVRGHGVYTPDIPCTGLWSLYSRYSLYGVMELAPLCGAVESAPLYGVMESAPLYGVMESAPLYGVMESAPLYGDMEFSPWLTGTLCWSSGVISGRMPFFPPPLTYVGFEPVTHCEQIVYSGH